MNGVDWLLLGAVLLLCVLGSLLVWSATSTRDDLTGGDPKAYLGKQVVNVAIGLVLMLVVMATDHRWVRILAPLVYAASVAGLVLVLTMGTTVNGSRSWLMLGGLSIQPSEFAKLAVVIGMALVVAERCRGPLAGPGRARRRDRDARRGRAAGRADPAPARPRHHAGALGHRLRGAGRRRCAPPLARRCSASAASPPRSPRCPRAG